MQTIKFNVTLEDLRALNPCYDPAMKLGNSWSGTLLDILNDSRIPDDDKIWAVTKLLDEKTARLFAIHCARASFKYITDVDKKVLDVCIETCNVAERFANGQATDEERSAAEAAAYSAAESAAYSAAESAAYSAAESAAYSAAYSAAESAAYSAAESAAYSAAYPAAWSAFVRRLIVMVTEQCAPVPTYVTMKSGVNPSDAFSGYLPYTTENEDGEVIISYEVLKYFGDKLKDLKAKELFMKALEELR